MLRRASSNYTDLGGESTSQPMYSTQWTYDQDINDESAVRSAQMLKLQSNAWLVHLIAVPLLTTISLYCYPNQSPRLVPSIGNHFGYHEILTSLLVLLLLQGFWTFAGLITPDRTSKSHAFRTEIRNFHIVIVTKGTNIKTVLRTYAALQKLERCHPSVKVTVLSDEPCHIEGTRNVICPQSYKTVSGRAKHKARALDYFRAQSALTEHDWILHMDEESIIDSTSLKACFDFIRLTAHYVGQGMIIYNGIDYFKRALLTVADGCRVIDDIGKFHIQSLVFNRPFVGVHGSFLLINGYVEEQVTWDFGSVTEDYEFSHACWRQNFSIGRIHGLVREQSPVTVYDFIKQRRRWFMGIRDSQFARYYLNYLLCTLWVVGSCARLATSLVTFKIVQPPPFRWWVNLGWHFIAILPHWEQFWAILFEDLDAGVEIWTMLQHGIMAQLFMPAAALLELTGALWAIVSRSVVVFDVVQKN